MAFKFKYPEEYYTKQAIKDSDLFTEKQLRQEYERLAKEKNRRLEGLERNYKRSKLLTETDKAPDFDSFRKRGKLDMSALSSEMNDAYKFIKDETTTLKGFRQQLKRSKDSFNALFSEKDDEGNVIKESRIFTYKNIWDLYDFLDEYAQMNKEQVMPKSEEVIDIYVEARRLNMDLKSLAKNMNYWKEHYQEMQNLEPIESTRPVSSDDYKKLI